MGKMHIMKPGEPVEVRDCAVAPPSSELRALIGGGTIEVVHVLFKGERAWMIVDDNGHAKALPLNEAAHEVYAAVTISRGGKASDVPPIAGTAVVFEGVRLD